MEISVLIREEWSSAGISWWIFCCLCLRSWLWEKMVLKKKKRLEGEEDLKFCKPSSFSSELSRSSLVCLCTDWTAYKPAWWSVYSSLRGREISASLLKVLPFSAVVQNSGCPFLASTAGRHCLQCVISWAEPQQWPFQSHPRALPLLSSSTGLAAGASRLQHLPWASRFAWLL